MMTDEIKPLRTWMPGSLLHGLIFAYAGMLGIETGAAAFVTRTVFPLWTASPEAVIMWNAGSPFYLEEGTFFMIASPLTFLLALLTLIVGWRAVPPLRRWLRMSTIVFILIFIWSVSYFIPVQDLMKGDAGTNIPHDELASMLKTFVFLNYIRIISLLFAMITALHTLGISYRMRV